MEIRKITNPHYLESGVVDCEVLFEGETEFVPYTATATDTTPTGQQIWHGLQSGKWGAIEPYSPSKYEITAAINTKIAEIERWRDNEENANIVFDWNGHRWDGGKQSKERLSPVTVLARANALPDGFFWTDADNHDVGLSNDELVELESTMTQQMVLRGFRIHERQRLMKGEVAQLKTLDDIQRYSVGWSGGTDHE